METKLPSYVDSIESGGHIPKSQGLSKMKLLMTSLLVLTLNATPKQSFGQNFDSSKLLQEAVDLTTQGGEAGMNFASQQEFDDLIEIQESTKGEHETVVGMKSDPTDEIVEVQELESATKSYGSVSYDFQELKDTGAKYHNHPTHGQDSNELILQGFSEQDKETNQNIKAVITNTQGTEVANNYTHFLGKAYEINSDTYQTVIASGLDNDDNRQRQTFKIGDKIYNHAVKCPDGQIRDVMDLEPHIAAEILRNRLMAVDNDEENVRIAA